LTVTRKYGKIEVSTDFLSFGGRMDLNFAFKQARRVATPLICITTPDPAALIEGVRKDLDEKKVPLFSWDIIRGLSPLNPLAKASVKDMVDDPDQLGLMTTNPTEALQVLLKMPAQGVCFFMNAHAFLESIDPVQRVAVSQGIWNLRDRFTADKRTLVLLCPGVTLPAELAQDVLVLDDPMPDDSRLAKVVTDTYSFAGLDAPASEVVEKAVNALRGLAVFPAEQAASMSLRKAAEGIRIDELWERKKKTVENNKGLSFVGDFPGLDQLGGLDQIKRFAERLFRGKKPPSVFVWLDELEKALGGSTGAASDTSGVSQDQLGVILSAMQENKWSGIILVGHPGSGKSAFAKAAPKTHGVPCVSFDLGAMKGSYVGQSEQQMRAAIKTVKAVGGEQVYFVATCNSLDRLPPELKRRFSDGIWMFDLPSKEERESIWKICLAKYGLAEGDRPNDNRWVGSDIETCCSLAWRLDISLQEASCFLTPVFQSDPEAVRRLQKMAEGKFLSASYPGNYMIPDEEVLSGRQIDIDSE
jgi:hypothetical protein